VRRATSARVRRNRPAVPGAAALFAPASLGVAPLDDPRRRVDAGQRGPHRPQRRRQFGIGRALVAPAEAVAPPPAGVDEPAAQLDVVGGEEGAGPVEPREQR
jgi:hypothetical protein